MNTVKSNSEEKNLSNLATSKSNLTYADIQVGMEVEYKDVWHSGILTWRKGIVEFADYGATRIKGVVFPDGDRKRIFPHRMHYIRIPV